MRSQLRYSITLKLIMATLAPLVTAVVIIWVIGSSIIVTRFSSQMHEVIGNNLGIPETSFLELRTQINLIFSGILVVVTIIGAMISAWLGTSLAKPIKELEEGARQIALGEYLPDIVLGSHDEIAVLAEEFNIMKHRLIERENEILALNWTLEEKVRERTAELEEKNQWLLVAQQELSRAERLVGIGLLASGVAHEINNPLAIIRGNAELLEMDLSGTGAGREELHTIMRQVGRIERIVRNLLVFSRGGNKQVTTFLPAEMLDSILDQIRHQIPLEAYSINRAYRESNVTISADEGQLRQVFTNLILNGLQAMGGSGVLTVNACAADEPGRVAISIGDTGPGISPEHLEKLFTPFFSTKRDGTGLGLAVSYGIIRDHGGDIRVDSTVGKGSVFTVLLPATHGADEAGAIRGSK